MAWSIHKTKARVGQKLGWGERERGTAIYFLIKLSFIEDGVARTMSKEFERTEDVRSYRRLS